MHTPCSLERTLHRFEAHCVSPETEANSELGPGPRLKHVGTSEEVQVLLRVKNSRFMAGDNLDVPHIGDSSCLSFVLQSWTCCPPVLLGTGLLHLGGVGVAPRSPHWSRHMWESHCAGMAGHVMAQ